MKKIIVFLLLFCLLFMASCGSQNDSFANNVEETQSKIIRETVEVPVEVVRYVEVPVVEVVEKPVEVIKETEVYVPVETIKYVEVPVVRTVEVPIETIREVEVVKEVEVPVYVNKGYNITYCDSLNYVENMKTEGFHFDYLAIWSCPTNMASRAMIRSVSSVGSDFHEREIGRDGDSISMLTISPFKRVDGKNYSHELIQVCTNCAPAEQEWCGSERNLGLYYLENVTVLYANKSMHSSYSGHYYQIVLLYDNAYTPQELLSLKEDFKPVNTN